MLREQVRVGDVCSDYHMKRTRLVEQANELARRFLVPERATIAIAGPYGAA